MTRLEAAVETLTWRRQLLEWRGEKDESFRDESTSPLRPAIRQRLIGLSYFPPDPIWRIQGTLRRDPDDVPLKLVPGRGIQPSAFVRYGTARLRMPAGPSETASVYATPHRHKGHEPHEPYLLFLPFRDATSGHETYSGGRYLEVPNPLKTEDEKAEGVFDFNFAYNPFCAYNDGYVCPLPPEANWLGSKITAGEQSYLRLQEQ